MPRLIDADALADELAVLLERNTKLIDEWLANLIEDAVDDAPTVDAVPTDFHDKCMESEIRKRLDVELNYERVVRCKDCLWCLPFKNGIEGICGEHYNRFLSDMNGYCSFAIRREDETD